jgi:hypothetical protein
MTAAAKAPAPAGKDDSGNGSGGRRRRPRPRGGGGGGRKKKEESKNNKSRKTNSNNKNKSRRGKSARQKQQGGGQQAVQSKITIRNIQDPARFGSIKKIVETLIYPMIEECNNTCTNNSCHNETGSGPGLAFHVQSDPSSFQQLIRTEELVEERRRREECERAAEAAEETDDKETNQHKQETGGDENENLVDGKKDHCPSSNKSTVVDKVEVVAATKIPSSLPTVTIRALHIVPPRVTRRRGERPGVAYLLVVAPPQKKTDNSNNNNNNSNKNKATDSSVPKTAAPDVPSSSASTTSRASNVSASKADNARYIAKSRLLNSHVVDCLKGLAKDDTKTQQKYGGCMVEYSLNTKTFKLPYFGHSGQQTKRVKHDRWEGTIESSEHFQQWLESVTKQKEELNTRPKPIPGGGMSLPTAQGNMINVSAATNPDGSTQPVAALVQHLLAVMEKKTRMKKSKTSKDDDAKSRKKKSDITKDRAGKGRRKDSSKSGSISVAQAGATAGAEKKKKNRRNRRREQSEMSSTDAKGSGATATKRGRGRRGKSGGPSSGCVEPKTLLKAKPNNAKSGSNAQSA